MVYEVMGRARKGYGSVWNDGEVAGGMGRCVGR